MRPSHILAWASLTSCASDNTCWMNVVWSCQPHMCRPHGRRCDGCQPLLKHRAVLQLALHFGRLGSHMGA